MPMGVLLHGGQQTRQLVGLSSALRVVSQRAPSWSPRFFDSLVADKVYTEVLSFAWAV